MSDQRFTCPVCGRWVTRYVTGTFQRHKAKPKWLGSKKLHHEDPQPWCSGGGVRVMLKPEMYKLVFNAKKWNEAGGDVGDNSQFWEPAKILETYCAFGDGELVAHVQWLDGSTSKGHIISCMKEVPVEFIPDTKCPRCDEPVIRVIKQMNMPARYYHFRNNQPEYFHVDLTVDIIESSKENRKPITDPGRKTAHGG